MFSSKYAELLAVTPGFAEEFDSLYARVSAYLSVEHDDDGTHTDVTADSLDVTGATIVGAPFAIRSTAILTTSAFTARQDNWAPTKIADAVIVRMSSDAARSLTGIQAPSGTHYHRKLLLNIGAFTITLEHDDSNSTDVNRFYGANSADVAVRPNGAAWVGYDRTSLRWRVEGV